MNASKPSQRSVRWSESALRERRAQMRGLMLLAIAVMIFVVARYGVHWFFTPGWWRLW